MNPEELDFDESMELAAKDEVDDEDLVLVPYLVQPTHEYAPGVPELFMTDSYMPPPAAQVQMPHLMEYIYEPGWIY